MFPSPWSRDRPLPLWVQQVRSQLGKVLQDAWLFEGTIGENIRYGRLDATDEEIVAAAEATVVDRFVRQLPEG